ncbi:MAG: HAMP domain-containing histidine kinase, partial [Anaerolineae bacterium]|nr:HAMP domain-containing histidine kinase [Anaerolineae bacterium]
LHDVPPDDPAYESVTAILRAGKRAHAVVRRLLGMARQQPAEEVRMALDVNTTVQNTLMLVKSHIQQGRVALDVDLTDALPPIHGMQGQLEDVWLNLLLNARDAVVERPRPQIGIRTGLSDDGTQVEVMVWDNGTGIPLSQQAQVFEPFFTTKPPGEGTGLGLHICKQIVVKCNGSIKLQSTYNQGTRFIIHLPVYTKRELDS